MKNKELKNIAAKVAEYEWILQTSEDKSAIHEAEKNIMELAKKVHSLEDMVAIDELVMEMLAKKNFKK